MTNKVVFKNCGVQENWINGKYHPSTSDKTISVISPYFDREIATVPKSNYADLDNAVQQAKAAFPAWASLNVRDRAEVMFNLKSIIENNLDEMAELIALDNGKTIPDA